MTSATNWAPIPASTRGAVCNVWLLQAGTISIPYDFCLLPAHETNNRSLTEDDSEIAARSFVAPIFVFLVEHVPTGDFYLYDLGMRPNIEELSPFTRNKVLPFHECKPRSVSEILKKHAPRHFSTTQLRAIILSHLHFDHIGDCGKEAFGNSELWIGPSGCKDARPGYPVEPESESLTDDFPKDGSRRIIEFEIPGSGIRTHDVDRSKLINELREAGHYEGIETRVPISGWHSLGSFDRAFDLFGDGSAYIGDSPGHAPGHVSLLLRVEARGSDSSDDDDFILLVGDSYHHADLLKDPLLTSRQPWSRYTIHENPSLAMESMFRARSFACRDNIWVISAHDATVAQPFNDGEAEVEGLVKLNEWRANGWKLCQL
ncbi:metallo-hydrolase oxidoreductase [Fusarium pseudocircinatum]|uniref:Metallo-hydrolase oxidoreductase n=1 Tax=Fusarium pseudocircinatum TaxID=56676 RepID=A0A8H5KDF7_9HYPO|nr:metallo-hydrolase oxidoreductase [Fusarium pseudocircinatum]